MNQLLGSRLIPSEDNLMKPKEIVFFPYHGDMPGTGSKEVVFLLERDPEETMEQAINNALIHLRKVANDEITERNYKPQPKSTERMIAEDVYRNTMHLDHKDVHKLYKEIKGVEDDIQSITDYRNRVLDTRAQKEKSELCELSKYQISNLDKLIHRIERKLNHYNQYHKTLEKCRDDYKQYRNKEFNAAIQRAYKTVGGKLPWEMKVSELRPGRSVPHPHHSGHVSRDLEYAVRDFGIIEGYKEELAKDPGPSGPGHKKRVISQMVAKLQAAGKRRTSAEKIRKILEKHGIN